MIQDEWQYRVLGQLGHEPTADQSAAIATFAAFMSDGGTGRVMVLRGSAGTGKTTLAGAIVRTLASMKQKQVLLAPTGRAAKVFALYAGHAAFTIHRHIYRQRTAALPSFSLADGTRLGGAGAVFHLNDNLHTDTLFVVDEASMISHGSALSDGGVFGSGSLLDDLVHYVYSGQRCRLLLIGDTAQLPPVGESASSALSGGVLRGYGLTVYEADLGEVLRQSRQSGILWNATMVRELMAQAAAPAGGTAAVAMPRLRVSGFPDIQVVPGDELIEQLASSYSRVGVDETIVITRSNKRANIYNQGIRRTVLDREDELSRGDQLMIVKNNYRIRQTGLPFLANGDRCVVQRVRQVREMHGFRFADVTVSLPDYDDCELTATTMLDTLTAEAPALTREQQALLYNKVMDDYADLPLKADRVKALRDDAYYNALQVKFGYAVTCHKAQGGQWAHVYIDQGYMTDDMLTADYLHWLYTALTRATERVFLVNWKVVE